MKFQPKLLALLLPNLLTLSCGGSEEAKTEPQPTQPQGSASSTDFTQERPSAARIFSGELATEKPRITQLPSDPFFVEFNYPGSDVYDVQLLFGSRQVYLLTTDSFETVDAFYAKKFASESGEVTGSPGRYLSMEKEGTIKRTKFERRPEGGCIIVISF